MSHQPRKEPLMSSSVRTIARETFLVFGLVLICGGLSLAQNASGMRGSLQKLNAVLAKEGVRIDPEIIWSNPTYSISPVAADPKKEAMTSMGGIIGAIYLGREIERFKQLRAQTPYALRL